MTIYSNIFCCNTVIYNHYMILKVPSLFIYSTNYFKLRKTNELAKDTNYLNSR